VTANKNRDRLLQSDIAAAFFDPVVGQARDAGLLSDEHFTWMARCWTRCIEGLYETSVGSRSSSGGKSWAPLKPTP
jgi:hypothetical protein